MTSDADPVYLTEIKTTTSLDHLAEPKEHHRAQLLAYLYALDEAYDYSITDGLLVYGSRKTLDIKTFHVTFDEAFWHTIVQWMTAHTEYRYWRSDRRCSRSRNRIRNARSEWLTAGFK